MSQIGHGSNGGGNGRMSHRHLNSRGSPASGRPSERKRFVVPTAPEAYLTGQVARKQILDHIPKRKKQLRRAVARALDRSATIPPEVMMHLPSDRKGAELRRFINEHNGAVAARVARAKGLEPVSV